MVFKKRSLEEREGEDNVTRQKQKVSADSSQVSRRKNFYWRVENKMIVYCIMFLKRIYFFSKKELWKNVFLPLTFSTLRCLKK